MKTKSEILGSPSLIVRGKALELRRQLSDEEENQTLLLGFLEAILEVLTDIRDIMVK